METKHTPGPWKIEKDYPNQILIVGIKGTPENMPHIGIIAEVAKGYWKEEVIEANARLIAAAPKMYDLIILESQKGNKSAIDIIKSIDIE